MIGMVKRVRAIGIIIGHKRKLERKQSRSLPLWYHVKNKRRRWK